MYLLYTLRIFENFRLVSQNLSEFQFARDRHRGSGIPGFSLLRR